VQAAQVSLPGLDPHALEWVRVPERKWREWRVKRPGVLLTVSCPRRRWTRPQVVPTWRRPRGLHGPAHGIRTWRRWRERGKVPAIWSATVWGAAYYGRGSWAPDVTSAKRQAEAALRGLLAERSARDPFVRGRG
jgi:hypothetical protein